MKLRAASAAACRVLVTCAAIWSATPVSSQDLGTVTFPNSGAAAAQPPFLRGVAALHDFEYEEAHDAFREAQAIDAGFALAYWGEAMTYNQTLWRRENVDAAREVLARLGPTPAARAAKAPTPREQGFLAAVETLFGGGDAPTRQRRYAEAMAELYARHPDDPEAATFYALALLGTASRSLIGLTHEGDTHIPALAGSAIQQRVATVLEKVLAKHPDHPGALHYLLHNYDDPAHARLALPAARRYAKVAPESSHALHMPAHIFLQLGLWHDAAVSDRAAFEASKARARRKGLGPAMHDYHALMWLQYELLQLGQYREAWETIAEIEPVVKSTGQLNRLSNLSSMRGRYVVETRHWKLLANERNFANVDELFAIGMSAARTGNLALAEMARQALAARSQAVEEGDLRPAIAIMEREVAALIELAGGRRDRAVEILRTAVAAELRLPPPLGLPEPVKPAPELLGEVLVEIGRPREAIQPFEQALARNANRSLAVLGLARAHAAAGDHAAAERRYRELLASFKRADADSPEVAEARSLIRR